MSDKRGRMRAKEEESGDAGKKRKVEETKDEETKEQPGRSRDDSSVKSEAQCSGKGKGKRKKIVVEEGLLAIVQAAREIEGVPDQPLLNAVPSDAPSIHIAHTKTNSAEEALADFPPERSGLKPEALAALPPDPPPGHAAFAKIRTRSDALGNMRVRFVWDAGKLGANVSFQISVSQASGNLYAAFRIARACYAKFEEGFGKDEVMALRDGWLCEFTQLMEVDTIVESKGKRRNEEESADSGKKRKTEEQPPRSRDESSVKAGAQCNGNGEGKRTPNLGEEATLKAKQDTGEKRLLSSLPQDAQEDHLLTCLPPDAPSSHMAHSKCVEAMDIRDVPCVRFCWKDAVSGKYMYQIQISSKKTAYSIPVAHRIARVCYLKAESGSSKDEVLKLRTECYETCANALSEGKLGDRSAAAAAAAAKSQRSDSEKKLDDGGAAGQEKLQKEDDTDEEGADSVSSSSAISSSSDDHKHVVPPERGRACAKMMVRAGHRCKCHFQRNCPIKLQKL